TSRPSPEDGAADAGSTHSLAPRGNMSRIGVQPAADQPDFVPTPPPPAAAAPLAPMAPPAPAPVRAAPTSAAADDAAGDTTPRTAEDMVGAVRYYKLDQALQQVVKEEPATPVRVIVRTTPGMHASTAALLSEAGREVHSVHAQIEGLSATLSASDVAVLSEDPSIARMSIDAVVKATAEPTPGDVLRGALGLTPNGGVVSSDKKWKGRRVRVAIIDSGIEPTDDLKKNRVRYFYDFTNGGVRTAPYDDYGHGTHVAGLIGGRGRMSGDEYEGPAPRARFVGVKVLDGTGSGYTSDVLAGLEYVINNNQKLRVDVINLSLGHPIFEPAATDPLVQAVERAVAEGIVVVASAGNMGMNPETGEVGYAGISSPGNAPSAITVGSVDLNYTAHRADDAVGPYSSRGPTWYDAFASRTWRHRDINWRQLRRCKVRFTKSTQTCRWPGATGRRLGICD
ncbi:MAG: S8 family serine peptidase, partial [Vicinamibacterales bacterium]|nr:S8 family serine peptidase [Vicinamibacterales bacterium]